MHVVALDTTTSAGSVALVTDAGVVIERSGDATRTHAERLPGDIVGLLHDAGVKLAAVDVFAIASGPGSFTGLRVGIATLQGLAFVNRRRIVPVSALEALAQIGSRFLPAGAVVASWIDAHRREVFSALYRVVGGPAFVPARLSEMEPPAVGDPASTLSRWMANANVPRVFIGDGAVTYADVLAGRDVVAPTPALAGAIGMLAVHRARAGEKVDPAGVQPLYIRRPDAELARESTWCPPSGSST
jgi:tRNA threonylcarbamoyladenosine biosynthesis protein TsaB